MLQNLKEDALINSIKAIAKAKTTQNIIPGENYIPVTGKVLDEGDILLGVDAALDGWLTAGRFANKFEYDFAQYFGAHKALLVNSGSSANLLAFYTLTSPKLGERAIKPGDEVITVAAGFPTTINPIIQFGAIPAKVTDAFGMRATFVEAAESDVAQFKAESESVIVNGTTKVLSSFVV